MTKELEEAIKMLRRLAVQNSPLIVGIDPLVTYPRAELYMAAVNVLESYDALKRRVKVLEEALGNIIKHQEFVGGSLSELSTTARIAREALAPPVGEKNKP